MNWTGGRLQRYSAPRHGPRARVSKANFAKSRRGQAKDVLQFQTSPQVETSHSTGRLQFEKGGSFCDLQKHHLSTRADSISGNNVSLGHAYSTSTNRLDDMKKQLLKRPDWAAVSVARPLKVAFTSTEKSTNFGKRRQLTEADQQRIAAYGVRRSFFKRRCSSQNSHRAGADDAEIRVNGKTIRRGSTRNLREPSAQPCQTSLHSEEPGRRQIFSFEDRSGHIEKRISQPMSSSLPMLASNGTSVSTQTSSKEGFPHLGNDCPETAYNNLPVTVFSNQESQTHSLGSSCTGAYNQYISSGPYRRFTLDDQVLAEKEGRLITTSKAGHSSDADENVSRQPVRSNCSALGQPASHTTLRESALEDEVANSLSSSSKRCSSLLPEQRWLINRRPFYPNKLLNINGYLNYESSPSSSFSNLRSQHMHKRYTSPVKLYGQFVLPQPQANLEQPEKPTIDLPTFSPKAFESSLPSGFWMPRHPNEFPLNKQHQSPISAADIDVDGDIQHHSLHVFKPDLDLNPLAWDPNRVTYSPVKFDATTATFAPDNEETAQKATFGEQRSSSASIAHSLMQHQQRRFAAALQND